MSEQSKNVEKHHLGLFWMLCYETGTAPTEDRKKEEKMCVFFIPSSFFSSVSIETERRVER